MATTGLRPPPVSVLMGLGTQCSYSFLNNILLHENITNFMQIHLILPCLRLIVSLYLSFKLASYEQLFIVVASFSSNMVCLLILFILQLIQAVDSTGQLKNKLHG